MTETGRVYCSSCTSRKVLEDRRSWSDRLFDRLFAKPGVEKAAVRVALVTAIAFVVIIVVGIVMIAFVVLDRMVSGEDEKLPAYTSEECAVLKVMVLMDDSLSRGEKAEAGQRYLDHCPQQ